ncbi:MAG: hypothetical protein NVS9B4_02060 [Candidatus Acidiferrum sp.]
MTVRKVSESLALPLPPKNMYEWQTKGLLRKTGATEEARKQGGKVVRNEREEGVTEIADLRIMGHGSRL